MVCLIYDDMVNVMQNKLFSQKKNHSLVLC